MNDSETERDCSIEELEKAVKDKFGEDLRDVNIWLVYEFLKGYCGIKDNWLPESEYHSRISKIINFPEF